MIKVILKELKAHAGFTALGAVSGIVLMFFFRNLPRDISYNTYYVLHPIHVLLSALVTASIYRFYTCASEGKKGNECNIWALLAVGYVGSVGIATLSDSLIPYLGEMLLDMPRRGIHLGFIEKWWLVNPLALLGIAIAYFRPGTKFPHSGHVLLSTWASLFHIMMARGESMSWLAYSIVFVFLFLAVWVPCCLSDIVFPLLFVKKGSTGKCSGRGVC